ARWDRGARGRARPDPASVCAGGVACLPDREIRARPRQDLRAPHGWRQAAAGFERGGVMAGPDEAAVTFEPHRRRLTGLAYRMLGSLSEAEDIVQDAYLGWHAPAGGRVANRRAYLSRPVAGLCLAHLKSAGARRETYVGPWLPEPIVDETALAPDTASELADDLSLALMMALERLSPL